jgi:lysophospholipase L1-like esterase
LIGRWYLSQKPDDAGAAVRPRLERRRPQAAGELRRQHGNADLLDDVPDTIDLSRIHGTDPFSFVGAQQASARPGSRTRVHQGHGTGARELRFQLSFESCCIQMLERIPMESVQSSIACGRADTGRLAGFRGEMTAATAVGLFGSIALFPLVALQGTLTRRRIPCLPPVRSPCRGLVPGRGSTIRLLAIGESTVAGVGLAHGEETVAATTARALARHTTRPVAWHGHGLSGATVSEAAERLLPRIAAQPADLLVIAFGVNDTIAYRRPAAFAEDLAALVTAARARIGQAAVVVAGVAPLACFPALPWPLRTILNWRSVALQKAAEGLAAGFPRLVVERFSEPPGPHLFAVDGFHPNMEAHALWGDEIASLALPLLVGCDRQMAAGRRVAKVTDSAHCSGTRRLPADLALGPAE